jgi:hypothetical protein
MKCSMGEKGEDGRQPPAQAQPHAQTGLLQKPAAKPGDWQSSVGSLSKYEKERRKKQFFSPRLGMRYLLQAFDPRITSDLIGSAEANRFVAVQDDGEVQRRQCQRLDADDPPQADAMAVCIGSTACWTSAIAHT